MGILTEGLEPLKVAQAQLLVRLDAVVAELRTMSELLQEMRDLMASQNGVVASKNGKG